MYEVVIATGAQEESAQLRAYDRVTILNAIREQGIPLHEVCRRLGVSVPSRRNGKRRKAK